MNSISMRLQRNAPLTLSKSSAPTSRANSAVRRSCSKIGKRMTLYGRYSVGKKPTAGANTERAMLKSRVKMANRTYLLRLLFICFSRMVNRVQKLSLRRATATKPTSFLVSRRRWYTTTSTLQTEVKFCVIPSSIKAVSTSPSAQKPAPNTGSTAMPLYSTNCTRHPTATFGTYL